MLSTTYSPLRAGDDFMPRAFVSMPASDSRREPYYQVYLDDSMLVLLNLTDAQCRQLMDALGSRDPLPKSDAQIDAEREDTGYAPTAGDTEVFRG